MTTPNALTPASVQVPATVPGVAGPVANVVSANQVVAQAAIAASAAASASTITTAAPVDASLSTPAPASVAAGGGGGGIDTDASASTEASENCFTTNWDSFVETLSNAKLFFSWLGGEIGTAIVKAFMSLCICLGLKAKEEEVVVVQAAIDTNPAPTASVAEQPAAQDASSAKQDAAAQAQAAPSAAAASVSAEPASSPAPAIATEPSVSAAASAAKEPEVDANAKPAAVASVSAEPASSPAPATVASPAVIAAVSAKASDTLSQPVTLQPLMRTDVHPLSAAPVAAAVAIKKPVVLAAAVATPASAPSKQPEPAKSAVVAAPVKTAAEKMQEAIVAVRAMPSKVSANDGEEIVVKYILDKTALSVSEIRAGKVTPAGKEISLETHLKNLGKTADQMNPVRFIFLALLQSPAELKKIIVKDPALSGLAWAGESIKRSKFIDSWKDNMKKLTLQEQSDNFKAGFDAIEKAGLAVRHDRAVVNNMLAYKVGFWGSDTRLEDLIQYLADPSSYPGKYKPVTVATAKK